MKFKKKMFRSICVIFIISILVLNICNTVKANETNNGDIINLSIGSINIDKYTANQEIIVPITIQNAKSLCAGKLHIQYPGNLTYIGTENEDSNFIFATQHNIEEGAVVVNFSSGQENYGDINLINLKFKLPEEVEDEQTYILQFTKDTTLTTLDIAKYEYEMNNGKVYIKDGNAITRMEIFKMCAVILTGLIIIGIVVVCLVRKTRKK